MKLANKSFYEKDVRRAIENISMGVIQICENEDTKKENLDIFIKGMQMIKSGANCLHSLSKIRGGRLFPVEFKEVMELVENYSIDEWINMYPFLKGCCDDLGDKKINLYDEVYLDEKDRFFSASTEYSLYVKYNNDLSFQKIREISENDLEYSFSRAYIPTVLEGGIIDINNTLKNIAVRECGISVSNRLITEILKNYYVEIPALSNYYRNDSGYALCRNCGSLMRKDKRGEIVCSFGKCQKAHFMKNVRFEIGGYINNPTRILRFEIMRFVKYPSIEERDIFEKLKKKYEKKGLISDLELYKGKDSCDISFSLKGRRQAIDFKEWENPIELAKALSSDNFKRNNGDADCKIVVPDYLTKKSNGRRNDYMDKLESFVVGDKMNDVDIMTVSEFFAYLERVNR